MTEKVQQVIDIKFHACGLVSKKFENNFEKHPEQFGGKKNTHSSHDRQLHVINLAAIY